MRIIRGSEIDFVPASHEDAKQPGVLKRVLATREELLDGRVQMINWASLPAGSSFRPHHTSLLIVMFDTAARIGNFVGTHRCITDKHELIVVPVLVKNLHHRNALTVSSPIVFPNRFIHEVVKVEILEMLEFGARGGEPGFPGRVATVRAGAQSRGESRLLAARLQGRQVLRRE